MLSVSEISAYLIIIIIMLSGRALTLDVTLTSSSSPWCHCFFFLSEPPYVSSRYCICQRTIQYCARTRGRSRGVIRVTRQPISCYYYACDLSYFDVVLWPSSSQIMATNAQISFCCKPIPPQCSLAFLARVPRVTSSKKILDPPMQTNSNH